LTLDLRLSRERIVLAREEERRRLRSDLHDGLGPGLAGLAMQVRAARRDPSLLEVLGRDLEACSAEVRALVDGLRPPVLDQGLAAALRRLPAAVECPDDFGDLPAAVEVAALRIAGEAVTNAAKHSGGAVCRVVARRSSTALELTITDDGRGLPAVPRPEGVGLSSMRERAEELSGTCTITSASSGGTKVATRLPLPDNRSAAYERGKHDVEIELAGGGAVVERPLPARVP
jgi:signal transduction histidine kinase